MCALDETIHFFYEAVSFKLARPNLIARWVKTITQQEGRNISILNYIFCTDEYLHQINLQYLAHDTLTDIITFDQTENAENIEGDIFISIERVKENANHYKIPLEEELHRVMIHGLWHLLGYNDHTPEEKGQMRSLENQALQTLSQLQKDNFLE